MNKKGSLFDVLFLAGSFLVIALAILFGFLIMSNFNDHFQASSVITIEGKTASSTLTGYFPGIVDNVFLFLVIGSAMAALVLASMVRVSPIFIPFFIVMLIFFTFITGILSNIYQEVAGNTNVVAYANQLMFISTVMEYLPLMVAAIGILLMVIMYKVNKSE